MRLSGKRALMIGAATGIGRACVEDFARNGARLVVADINEPAAAEAAALARAAGSEAGHLACGVRDEAAVAKAVATAEKEMGGLDTLVCFAGLMRTGDVDKVEAQTWDAIFDVNARGTFFAAKHGTPALRRAGGGSFITTASLAGLRGAPGMTAYAAAKGAVIAFTTALAQELAPFNNPAIDYMGGVGPHAEIVRRIVPLGRQGTPAEVAPMYTFLASEESRYVTAKSMMVDGGMAH